jgi:hypothetical protein
MLLMKDTWRKNPEEINMQWKSKYESWKTGTHKEALIPYSGRSYKAGKQTQNIMEFQSSGHN